MRQETRECQEPKVIGDSPVQLEPRVKQENPANGVPMERLAQLVQQVLSVQEE